MSFMNQGNGLHQRENGDRTQLFGTNYENLTNRASSPYDKGGSLDLSQSTLSNLENQSAKQMSAMGERVTALKNLSLRMGEEIRGSNETTAKLGDIFEGTGKQLKSTYRDMMKMAKNSRIPLKTWLIIFFTVSLLFFWVWIR